ncbi:DotU family type VI secretion system protein [Xylophilus rhododendri]|uniref:DotU family type VI secretion system protein n=1 Tax=Xylophilus rhododendri TaxID=2697032 RepID=A0A857JCZ1_9BURK|nr:DotU family type VI secretion system protein [Xylophilus rhododendri]QHJ00970.1 DotU family type VI secretion system protein [Xylophilus rhododendri]
MSDDNKQDPFAAFNSDRTIIKPSAGRPRADAPAGNAPAGGGGGGAAAPQMPPSRDAPLPMDALMATNLNPLVAAAAPLLAAAPRVRTTARHPNPAGLKEALAEGVRKFESQARAQGLPNEQVIAARYILCTLLDESAASTPWGGSGAWSAQSLLVQFHNETWGGEKVFQLMSKLAENVEANRNLLELLYVVLAFGFEGRYRVIDNGRAQLDSVRERLMQLLRKGKPAPDKALSPRWQGEPAAVTQLGTGLPIWVLATLAALVLAGILMVLRFSLGDRAEPVFATLAGLEAKAAVVSAASPPPPPPPAPSPRLATFLQPEVAAGLVQVQDFADRSVVTIKGDGFFEPGSAVIAPAVRTLLPRIAQALSDTPGQVLITGHTDNQPIRTLRYPSNWHLSQDRADAVKTELAKTVKPERLRAEGRADSESVSDNGSPAGRAKNRRVEVTLFVQQADAAR